MNQSDFEPLGFRHWLSMTDENRASVYSGLPKNGEPGVYVFRYKEQFGRFRGQSDILYVGRGIGQGGLKGRVQKYYGRGKEGHRRNDLVRIRQMWLPATAVWIAFKVTETPEQAKRLETELLEGYKQQHGEYPPANGSAGER